MNEQTEFINRVAQATGSEIVLAADGSCDFAVGDAVITAMYRPAANDWLLTTTVLDTDEAELPPESLAIVLRQSLFGAGTLGFMPGLFANAIVLSGGFPADDLSVDAFVAKCERLAEARERLAARLDGLPDAPAEEDADEPEADGVERFMI